MPFTNRIRLPFYLRAPQFPTTRNVFRKSDGTTKVLSIQVQNTYQGLTDQMTKEFHQKLIIALSHDNVTIEGDRLSSGVSLDGDYQINWQEFLDNPIAQAAFQVQVTPFNESNDNCQTCEEATQLTLVDDDAGTVTNNTYAIVELYPNDSICCFPATLSITWFDPTYLSGVTLADQTLYPGQVYLVTLASCPSSPGSVIMATYRITCPNGGYDEANIYLEVIGNEVSCIAPSNLSYAHIEESEISVLSDVITFTESVSLPTQYDWQLYLCSDLGTPIDEGITDGSPLTFFGLEVGTCYVVSIRSVCDAYSYSEWVSLEFTTDAASVLCGRFTVSGFDASKPSGFPLFYTYMNCTGVLQNGMVPNFTSKFDCFLVDESNVPIYFSGTVATTYIYTAPC